MGSGIGILTAAAILLGRTWLPQLFSQDPYVIAAASRALPIVAFSMVRPPPSCNLTVHQMYERTSFGTRYTIPPTDSCMSAAWSAVVWDADCHTDPIETLRAILSPSAVQQRASQALHHCRKTGKHPQRLLCSAAAGSVRAVAGGNGAGRQPDHMGGRAHRPVGHSGALILLARQQPGVGAAGHLGRSALSASASPASWHSILSEPFPPQLSLISPAASTCWQWQGLALCQFEAYSAPVMQ